MRMHALCIYSRDPIAAENLSGSSLSILACQSFLPRFSLPSKKSPAYLSTHRTRIFENFFFLSLFPSSVSLFILERSIINIDP